MSPAGLFPAALAGIDTRSLLAGAAAMDQATRSPDTESNPALRLASVWRAANRARNPRNMVILPYRDRLALLGRYLQQLVMESLGKGTTRGGERRPHGLTVYGHKGSTDQHALIQQLRDGPDDAFVTFVNVLSESAPDPELPSGLRGGDLLSAFVCGTREALEAAGRPTVTLTLERLDAAALGALIALFERTVGLYGTLININAYDQPGVEAAKGAASAVLQLQGRVLAILGEGASGTAADLAELLGESERRVFHVLRRLAATDRASVAGTGRGRTFGPGANGPESP
jgi:glucose-6-phosphate isomerase